MEPSPSEQLDTALKAAETKVCPAVMWLRSIGGELNTATANLLESSSQSWVGWYASLYYRDFEAVPMGFRDNTNVDLQECAKLGWRERSHTEVGDKILELANAGVTWDEFAKKIQLVRDECVSLRDEVFVIVPEASNGRLDKVVQEIEALRFDDWRDEYFQKVTSSQISAVDTKALMQGRRNPPHVHYQAAIYEATYLALQADELLRLTRLVVKLVNGVAGERSLPPAGFYVDAQIVASLTQKHSSTTWQLDKLLQLIQELNDNYAYGNPYSCHALLRAILDHVPPMLGCKSFEEVANNYAWSRTDKAYMQTLRAFRHQADDVLHRQVRKSPDLIRMEDLPSRTPLNALLTGCVDAL